MEYMCQYMSNLMKVANSSFYSELNMKTYNLSYFHLHSELSNHCIDLPVIEGF